MVSDKCLSEIPEPIDVGEQRLVRCVNVGQEPAS